MLPNYNLRAPKKSANLSINSELLRQAKALDINLSATLEQALADVIKNHEKAQWLAENKVAIEAYNEHVKDYGVFSDGLRSF